MEIGSWHASSRSFLFVSLAAAEKTANHVYRRLSIVDLRRSSARLEKIAVG
jgi:hypothetical protein